MTSAVRGLGLLTAAVAVLGAAAPAGALDILVADDAYGFTVEGEVVDLGFLVDVLPEHDVIHLDNASAANEPRLTNDLGFLSQFDVVIFYNGGNDNTGRAITPAEFNALESYIEAGGNLIVTGRDMLGDPADPLLAALVRSADFGEIDEPFDHYVTADADYFMLLGPYGDLRDLEIGLSSDATDHDVMMADASRGAVWVAAVEDTAYDKIIFTALPVPGGSVGAWNGNDLGDDWFPGVADGDFGLAILANWLVDDDDDGVLDGIDNCLEVSNPSQRDSDGDGVGDACDECPDDPEKFEPGDCGCGEPEIDEDGDGVGDCIDNCPDEYNPTQRDSDQDGIGDACDPRHDDGEDDDGPIRVVCGLGATQALTMTLVGLGLAKVGLSYVRRRKGRDRNDPAKG